METIREITRKSVLMDCLEIMRQELAVCSKNYNGLEPKEGMEEEWDIRRRKCGILGQLIHAYDSEPVRAAIASWQKEIMQSGPPKSLDDIKGPEDYQQAIERQNIEEMRLT